MTGLGPAQARQAALLLLDHARAGTRFDALPEPIRPLSRADGYRIQTERMTATGEPLFGWKIAATSLAGQTHINVDGPLAGRIFAESVRPAGATISLADNAMRVAELEFAFRMARDLTPRADPYDMAEVLDAVATLHPAIEIPDSRFTDFCAVGAAQLIADNACAREFMLGAAVTADWRNADLSAHPVVAHVAGRADVTGIGANALGDPRIALVWIANELSAHGITLRAGEVVTTGTCVVPVAVVPGDSVTADFGRFGGLSVRFA